MTKQKKGDTQVSGDYIVVSGDISGSGHAIGKGTVAISGPQDMDELSQLFSQLRALIESQTDLQPENKTELVSKVDELEQELSKPEADIGRISQQKKALASAGPWIIQTLSAVFANPSVVKIVEQAAKRLIGG